MANDFAQIAHSVWSEDRHVIAELQGMTPEDIKHVEQALFDEQGMRVDLSATPDAILAALHDIKIQKSQLAVD